ncbi:MAG: peptidase S41 [Nonomuraea sp.]|nr:peptidase S41 [Nonomuraea sp.]NUP80088.1 peptidase S41 [Nonomuraea sp.]
MTYLNAGEWDRAAVLAAVRERAAEPPAAAAAAPVYVPDDHTTVAEFLRTPGALTLAERKVIARQALLLLEQNYAHLPLKVSMYGINPLQRLRLLLARAERQTDATMDPEQRFHQELLSVFTSLHDLHTTYELPTPYAEGAAFLPFRIEQYAENGEPRYLVAQVTHPDRIPEPVRATFVKGAEVTHWNGVPIDRAVDAHGERFAGSNPAARHAIALRSLPFRVFRYHLPPDEDFVTVGFAGLDGRPGELRLPWTLARRTAPAPVLGGAQGLIGLDHEGQEIAELVASLVSRGAAAAASPSDYQERGRFLFRRVTAGGRTFGHVRIKDFKLQPLDTDIFETDAEFAEALRRHVVDFLTILDGLPQDGLVLDIRDNPGGTIVAGEILLQLLTPRTIQPEPAQLLTTPQNLRLARLDPRFARWESSVDRAVETGVPYSEAFPLTTPELANRLGQFYQGPVVLITNALCYSTADIFAAGFADHGIGVIVSVDGNTGAGGGNVVEHKDVIGPLGEPYEPLPRQANLHVAIRRTLRVGEAAGTPLEDYGVTGELYRMTRRDLLEGNPDLMERAAQALAGQLGHRLALSAEPGDATLFVTVESTGLDRVDLYVDGRPRASADLTESPLRIAVHDVTTAGELRAEGFTKDGRLAVTATEVLS